jgi:phospholipid transport system substrate-binding protein
MKKYHLPLLFFASALLPFSVSYGQAAQAEAHLRKSIDQVVEVLLQPGSAATHLQKLRPVLERSMCFETMTRRAVGPGWRDFSAPDQKAATDYFTTVVIRRYTEGFTLGERPVIKFLGTTTPGADRAEIKTNTIYEGKKYEVIYRLENRGGWRVTDVIIEGVSLVANYRAQFDSLFKRGGAKAVLDSLQRSAARNP